MTFLAKDRVFRLVTCSFRVNLQLIAQIWYGKLRVENLDKIYSCQILLCGYLDDFALKIFSL